MNEGLHFGFVPFILFIVSIILVLSCTILASLFYIQPHQATAQISNDNSPPIKTTIRSAESRQHYYNMNNDTSILYPHAYISNYNGTKFMQYENTHLGLKIVYPINWEKIEYGINNVKFLAPYESSSDKYLDRLLIYADASNKSLSELTSAFIDKDNKSLLHYKLQESTGITLLDGTIQGRLLLSTYTDPELGNLSLQKLEVLTKKGHMRYVMQFLTESQKYSTYLPTIQKMIDSFEIIRNNEDSIITRAALDNMVPYENSTLGVRIQYPFNWQKREDLANGSLQFISPLESSLDKFCEYVKVSVKPMVRTKSLEEITADTIYDYKTTYPDHYQFNASRPINLGKDTAEGQMILHTYLDPKNNTTLTELDTLTTANGDLYRIQFFAQPQKYSLYLPLVDKIIDSFQIIDDIDSVSNNSGTNTTTIVAPETANRLNQTGNITTTNMLIHENSTLDVRIQYPSDWDKLFNYNYHMVAFLSPLQDDSDKFSEQLKVSVFPLTSNISLDELAEGTHDTIVADKTSLLNYHLNETKIIKLKDGNLAILILFKYQSKYFGVLQQQEIGIVKSGKIYTINYYAKPDQYFVYLPTIQKMIDSFEIIEQEQQKEGARPSPPQMIFNIPPVAIAGPERAVSGGEIVKLNGTKSFDPDGKIVSYSWKLIEWRKGDPQVILKGANTSTSTFIAPNLLPISPEAQGADAGHYIFELTVKDNEGLTASDRMFVVVSPTSPPAS